MWPREGTKVIAAELALRRRNTAVLSSLSTSVLVALLTLKMYQHIVIVIVIVIITLPLGLSAFEQRGCESSHSKNSLGLNPLKPP
jgi:uncharacterized membrane protein YdbT with pleckstrin-like domain